MGDGATIEAQTQHGRNNDETTGSVLRGVANSE